MAFFSTRRNCSIAIMANRTETLDQFYPELNKNRQIVINYLMSSRHFRWFFNDVINASYDTGTHKDWTEAWIVWQPRATFFDWIHIVFGCGQGRFVIWQIFTTNLLRTLILWRLPLNLISLTRGFSHSSYSILLYFKCENGKKLLNWEELTCYKINMNDIWVLVFTIQVRKISACSSIHSSQTVRYNCHKLKRFLADSNEIWS